MSAFVNGDFWVGVGVLAGIYGIFTLGLQLNLGLTGIYNFGQVGFMALGGYAMGIFVVHWHWSLWPAIVAALALSAASGVLLGLAAVRLRADYFAVTSLAFASIVALIALNERNLTGGGQGLLGFDDDWGPVSDWLSAKATKIGLPDSTQTPLLIVSWMAFLLLVALLRWLQRTPWGRVVQSVREDEVLTEAIGKNVLAYKLQSLALAATFGGLSGCLLALDLRYLVPEDFGAAVTFTGFTIMLIGGWATFTGVAFGSVVLWTVLEGTRFVDIGLTDDRAGALRFIIVGLALMFIARFRPQGLLGRRGGMTFGD